MRIGDRSFGGTARIVDDGDEDAMARRLLLDKYSAGYSGDLTGWGRDSLPVAVDLDVGYAVLRRSVVAPSTSASSVAPRVTPRSASPSPPSEPSEVTRLQGRRTRTSSAPPTRSPRAARPCRGAATSSPHSRNWGRMNAGMNWTAWNSVRANALVEQAERHPKQRVGDREHDHEHRRARRCRGREDEERERPDDRPLNRGDDREGEPVPGQQVELRPAASSSAARASPSSARAAS